MGKELERLAVMEQWGLCRNDQREELARQTIRLAGKRVAGLYHTDIEEHRDTTMEAAERTINRIMEWRPERGTWSTFVAWCARSTVRDHVIRIKWRLETIKTLRKESRM